MSPDEKPAVGLRERKKAKTMANIQMHALRLFRESGYNATTVEQIAEAAEISPSTFFRYFPTKEDVVASDSYDPLLIAAFEAQPPGLSPSQAIRGAMIEALSQVPAEELELLRERNALIFSVPELRAAALGNLTQTIQIITGMVAERVGRAPDDYGVRVFAGAVVGACTSIMLYMADHPEAEFGELLDKGMTMLETGFPL